MEAMFRAHSPRIVPVLPRGIQSFIDQNTIPAGTIEIHSLQARARVAGPDVNCSYAVLLPDEPHILKASRQRPLWS